MIRKTPKSPSLVVNVDKLKKYYGEIPLCWKRAIKKESATKPVGNFPTADSVAGQTTALAAGAIAPNSRPQCHRVAGPGEPVSRSPVTVTDAESEFGRVAGQSATLSAGAAARRNGPITVPVADTDQPEIQAACATPLAGPAATPTVAGRPQQRRRIPARYCSRVKMEREDRHHYCLECRFRFRSRGSCYKHAVKKHGKRYVPGKPLVDIPDDELAELQETYRWADLNPRQRAKAKRQWPRNGSASPAARRRRRRSKNESDGYRPPRRRCRQRRRAAMTESGPRPSADQPERAGERTRSARRCPAAAGCERDLYLRELTRHEFDHLIRPSDSAQSLSGVTVFRGSPERVATVRTVRTAASGLTDDEAPSLGCPLGDLSRQSDVPTDSRLQLGDGPPVDLRVRLPPWSWWSLQRCRRRCNSRRKNRLLDRKGRPNASSVRRVRKQRSDVPVSVATTDTATAPPTVSEVQAWQLGTTIEYYYPHRGDQTEYGRHAVRLAIRAMHVYEQELARLLQDTVTTAMQHFTRFQLTACSRGPSATAGLLVKIISLSEPGKDVKYTFTLGYVTLCGYFE